MMKKIKQKKVCYSFIICILMLLGTTLSAEASTVEVRSLSSFSTANPPAAITVQLLEPLSLDAHTDLDAGTEITGKLVNVKSPKRLKRSAKFSFKPMSYKAPDGSGHIIKTDICAKYTTKPDKKQIAESAVKGVGSVFVKGFGMGYSAIEGAVKNEQDNVLKSSAVSLYQSSPISYVEKGKDIEINKSDTFYLKFPDPNKEIQEKE